MSGPASSVAWAEDGAQPPLLRTAIPGPASLEMANRLAKVECGGITWLDPEGRFPIFWDRAFGANVWDADDNRLVDLTAAFGVAAYGHAHPNLVEVAQRQTAQLMHGMGDVHPPTAKLELLEALTRVAPDGLGQAVLGLNGADAVEAALKAAWLSTGRPGVIAFEGGYHGLLGFSLDAVGHPRFLAPFAALLPQRTTVLPYPYSLRPPVGVSAERVAQHSLECVERRLKAGLGLGTKKQDASEVPVGAVLVEPVQARGGEVVPPPGFLKELANLCKRYGAMLIADEIFTGFGRTGMRFACEHDAVVPDLLVVGKALTGGFPLSACLGTEEVMRAWPTSTGEAIHTSTFLGHPVACAVASAAIDLGETLNLPQRANRAGLRALQRLQRALAGAAGVAEVRGRGLLLGIELVKPGGVEPDAARAARVMLSALAQGFVLLPSGRLGNVIGLSPPLTIAEPLLDLALDAVVRCIKESAS